MEVLCLYNSRIAPKSPFFGSFINKSFNHSVCIFSACQILFRSVYIYFKTSLPPNLKASGGIPFLSFTALNCLILVIFEGWKSTHVQVFNRSRNLLLYFVTCYLSWVCKYIASVAMTTVVKFERFTNIFNVY